MIFTNSFVNCEYIKIYIIINEIIVFEVCKQLQIESYSLSKLKLLRDYNEQLIKKFITYIYYSFWTCTIIRKIYVLYLLLKQNNIILFSKSYK